MTAADATDVSLEQLLELVADLVLDRIRGFEIGRATSFDADQQSASVQPVVHRAFLSESGDRVSRPPKELHDVPVWYFGTSRARLTSPVAPGDYGLILYSPVSLALWKRRGGVVDPRDDRRHDESDAIFIPGMHSLNSPPTEVPDDTVIHSLSGARVLVGGPTGTHKTVMSDPFLSALDTLVSAIATAVGGVPGGSGAQAAITAAGNVFKSSPVRTAYLTTVVEVK